MPDPVTPPTDYTTEPIKVLATILQIELGLKPDQAVLYNQKFDIPSDDRLYLSVGLLGFKTFGNRAKHVNDPVTNELVLEQGLNRQEMYSVVIFSRGSAARERNWEIPLALKSDTAQTAMEKRSMSIAQIPASMNDVSDQDGTARLNKYSLTVMGTVAYQKTKAVDYFDQFQIPPVIVSNP